MKIKTALALLFLPIALTWLKSSMGKIISGGFPDNLEKTLAFFASKNPYPWYKEFLQTIVIPNAKTVGVLVMWGEFLTGLALLISIISLVFYPKKYYVIYFMIFGLIGGIILNLLFWLAAGWTSASTDGLNLLMLFTEAIGLYIVIKLIKAD